MLAQEFATEMYFYHFYRCIEKKNSYFSGPNVFNNLLQLITFVFPAFPSFCTCIKLNCISMNCTGLLLSVIFQQYNHYMMYNTLTSLTFDGRQHTPYVKNTTFARDTLSNHYRRVFLIITK